jgi:hypothetical protein
MAKKKISELPAGGALNGTELVPIVQTGTTKRITAQDIANLGNASGVEGSGTINRLAKFTATSTIGNSQLFDDGTSVGLGTITPLGLLHLFKASATTRMVMDGNASQNRVISYRTNAVQRFGLYVNNTAESGSNVGSDFQIRAYSDAGTLLSTPLFIKRSTGLVGIGTTSPQAKLHSNADILTGYFQNGTNGIYDALKLTNNTASNTLSGNGARIQFYNNSNNSTNLIGSSIRSVNVDYGWASDLILSSVRNNSYTTQTAIDVLTLSSSGNATFGSSVTAGDSLLINNLSVSKKGYKFQSPSSNWAPQQSGIFFTPADGANAATTFSVELWDGNGNTNNALSIAPLGAAKFSSNIGWGGVTTVGDGANCSTIEGANGAQIAARNGFAQLYIGSNVIGTPYAATRSVAGYATQLSLDALGGTISLNRAVSGAAGSSISWINVLGFDNAGAATFNNQLTINQTAAAQITSERGNSNTQGVAQLQKIIRQYTTTGLGTKLIIPFVSQGNLNSTTFVRIIGHSARFNNNSPQGFSAEFALGHLNALANLSTLNFSGNILSIAINGMNIEITFVSGYTGGTADGVFTTIEYMTNNVSWSIDVPNITMN